jgi:hypothetical protein
VYWEIISKGAELINHVTLPTAKGPLNEFTMAEKVATKTFMNEAGYGISPDNQRQYRILWKSLSEMRKAKVDKILFYRTKDFDKYCKRYSRNSKPSLLDTVLSWEELYGSHIEQLEIRVVKLSERDFLGRSYLGQPHVVDRLQVQESLWNDAVNEWFSIDEEAAFKLTGQLTVASTETLWGLFDRQAITEGGRNKSLFISLLPKGENFLSVCPIIPVQEGDFLGLFAGMTQFSENFNATHGIRGLTEKLWLDYSRVTGTLNQMQVLKPSEDANVRLQWELINDGDKEKPSSFSWRVSVRAIRAIMPFEEITRAAFQKEQYLLHRSPVYARRGFIK